MRRSRKIILALLLTVVVLAGTIGGVALAQTEDEEENQPETQHGALLERVCEIYNANPDRPGDIDYDLLKDAIAQAGSQLRAEAREQFRLRLIEEGKVTQEQLDEFDAWMAAKPDGIPFADRNHDGMKRFGGFGKFGGKFRGWCQPSEPAE